MVLQPPCKCKIAQGVRCYQMSCIFSGFPDDLVPRAGKAKIEASRLDRRTIGTASLQTYTNRRPTSGPLCRTSSPPLPGFANPPRRSWWNGGGKKLRQSEACGISFGRKPEDMKPLRDLLQQMPHLAAECNEVPCFGGCRPRIIRESFPEHLEFPDVLLYIVAPITSFGIARVGAGREDTNRRQNRPEAIDATCTTAGQLLQLRSGGHANL